MLEVTILNAQGEKVKTFSQENDEDFDFVSLVAPTTYGPPALIAPTKDGRGPLAEIEDRVLYINTGQHGPPMWSIERISD